MSRMPSQAAEMLMRTSRPRNLRVEPFWLLGEMTDPRWKVRVETSEFQDGEWRNLVTLRWDIVLPHGSLADIRYRDLVSRAQWLLVATYDLGEAIVPERLISAHRKLLHVLERVILDSDRDGDPVPSLGRINAEALARILGLYQVGGAGEVANFYQRFRGAVEVMIQKHGEEELERWFSHQSAAVQTSILTVNRPCDTNEPEDTEKLLITETAHFLHVARIALAKEGFYCPRGHLRSDRIAEAVQCDIPRISRAWRLSFELRQFEHATDYFTKALPYGSTRTERTAGRLSAGEKYQRSVDTREFANVILTLCASAARLPEMQGTPFADLQAIEDSLAIYRLGPSFDKTRTIPNEVALQLLRQGLKWCVKSAPQLVKEIKQFGELALHTDAVQDYPSVVARIDHCYSVLDVEPICGVVPTQFWRRLATESRAAALDGDSNLLAVAVRSREMGMCDLVDLHQAICFSIIACFGCARLTEVLELQDEDLVCRNNRWFLRVRIRKNKTGRVRRVMMKPVPPLVAMCIHSLIDVRKVLKEIGTYSVGSHVFFSVVKSGRLVSRMTPESIYPRLDTMSEFFDLRTASGNRWHVSPHELRRLYAMSFFQYGDRLNALPGLSWFMGHGGDVQKTWHYIKEDLDGAEISSIEAAWASVALRADHEQASAAKLNALVMEHFGVDRISALSDEDLQDYLEVLQKNGRFSVDLKPIRDGRGQRYIVLVHIRGD